MGPRDLARLRPPQGRLAVPLEMVLLKTLATQLLSRPPKIQVTLSLPVLILILKYPPATKKLSPPRPLLPQHRDPSSRSPASRWRIRPSWTAPLWR